MKKLFSLLSLIKDYKPYAVLNIVLNLLSVIFGLFSLGMLAPFLNLIFLKTDAEYASYLLNIPASVTLDSLSFDLLVDHAYYFMADLIINNPEGGKMQALVMICILMVVFVFLYDIHLSRYFEMIGGTEMKLRSLLHLYKTIALLLM